MELNRKNIQKILLLISGAILIYLGLSNISALPRFIGNLVALMAPFILGLCIAFIVNAPMRMIETRLFAPLNRKNIPLWKKVRRPLCMVLSLALFCAILMLIFLLVIPEMARTFGALANTVPAFIERTSAQIVAFAQKYEWASFTLPDIDWDSMIRSTVSFLQSGATNVLNITVSLTSSIFSGIVTSVLAFVFSIYLLLQKERLILQVKRVLFACLPAPTAQWLVKVGALSNRIFSSFISGQFTEAFIIGTLCFIGMSVLSLPFALMISVLVGFTALIPVFGAFIGTGVGVVLILTVSPLQALWFIIFIVVLQQLEGNLIYPHVVGTSVGLPGIWVLFAVTLGGSMFGMLGMLVGVPVCSILYCLAREAVAKRLKEKGVSL